MNRQSQLVAALLVAHGLFTAEGTHAACQSAPGAGVSHHQNPQIPTEARELPAAEHAKLKTKALSMVTGNPGPRIRNPRLSRDGLDGGILAVLYEQRQYLQNAGEPTSPPSLPPGSPTVGRAILRTAQPSSCLNPVIFAVNGRAVAPVFTPHQGDNLFRIAGCGFGSAPGEVRLELETSPPLVGIPVQPTALQLEPATAWSENQIDVRLDPRLTGVADSMATLVVHLADGRHVELRGCRFVAVRGEAITLKTIAAPSVKLAATGSSSRSLSQFEYMSPPAGGEDIPHDASKMSAFVIRADTQPFAAGTDTYDFSGLNPGWVVESMQIQSYHVACPGDVTRTQSSGESSATVEDRALIVNWASYSCSSFIPPTFRFTMASSEYAVKVWVIGPVGTEPVGIDRR